MCHVTENQVVTQLPGVREGFLITSSRLCGSVSVPASWAWRKKTEETSVKREGVRFLCNYSLSVPMAISNSPENLDRISNPERTSELHRNIRKRPNANTENEEAVPDSSSRRTNDSDTGNSSEISEVDAKDQIGNGDDQKEKASSLSNGERTENGEGQEPQVDVPVTFTYRPSTPAHRRIKESPLSSDAIFKQSHAGLFNLCIIVLVAVNSRLIIENLMKYGLLMSTEFWFSSRSLKDWPLFMCCLTLPIFPLGALTVEKLRHHEFISEPVVVSLHIMITVTAMLYPVLMILRFDSAILSGIILMLFTCVVWLKLVSYAHTNYDMRALTKSIDKESGSPMMDYSYDVSFKSLAYFMLAPTLCYQPSYPRTTCIRKGCVIRQLIKLVIFTGLMGFIIEQYINPIVQNSQHPLKGNLLNAIERVLKLSVPTLYVWLCMFYCFFHLWLNILAELLCFGDREFYKDWWNAKTAEEYWRMWNMPVHKWLVRHVYFPCLRNGIPKGVAVVIAFFISAIFHELCIGVPCHMVKFWAFMGIMLQVPLVLITNYLQRKFRNTMVGNMTFWFFFSIFGQPMCVLLYYHDVMGRKVRTE